MLMERRCVDMFVFRCIFTYFPRQYHENAAYVRVNDNYRQEAQLLHDALFHLISCQLLHSCTKKTVGNDDLESHSRSSELPLFDSPWAYPDCQQFFAVGSEVSDYSLDEKQQKQQSSRNRHSVSD